MPPSLILHIGTQKTGTTSLQQFCTEHGPFLETLGVHYPKLGGVFHDNNHTAFAASYLPDRLRPFRLDGIARPRAKAAARLREMIEQTRQDTILLSSEIFSSHFSRREIELLADDFARYRPKIVVVVRDHLSLVLSSYSTRMRTGERYSLEQYIDALWNPALAPANFRGFFFRHCRYKDMIGQWERVFGKENVRVLAYRPEKTIDVVFSEILQKKTDLAGRFAYQLNDNLPWTALKCLRAFNASTPNLDELHSIKAGHLWPHIQEKRNLLISLLISAGHPDGPSGSPRLDPGRRQKIAALAQADRPWLAEKNVRLEPAPAKTDRKPSRAAAAPKTSPALAELLNAMSRIMRPDETRPAATYMNLGKQSGKQSGRRIHARIRAARKHANPRTSPAPAQIVLHLLLDRLRDLPELERIAAAREDMLRSLSWKLTKPLRRLGALLLNGQNRSQEPGPEQTPPKTTPVPNRQAKTPSPNRAVKTQPDRTPARQILTLKSQT